MTFQELTASLGLPDRAVGDLLSGLRAEGLVEYEAGSGVCRPGGPLRSLPRSGGRPDCNDVRSAAMPWADTLAAHSGMSVLLAVAHPRGAQIIHHVFRPDNSPQRLVTGDIVPAGSALARALREPCDGRCVHVADDGGDDGGGGGTASLATAVLDPDGGRPVAALALTGPRTALRATGERAHGNEELLLDAARAVSSALEAAPVR
ncbi:IclR family transcriptional regulator [Streptomyces caatingaensis]|uniref:IclR family transcriptional regulator n=1 Tax=Streptomyces caatingaensis TaxID=1678637 RepID=A0A0K9XGN9_9ACTN|nr:IclR family transcriptional regulator [Streptomyces caatingaensis]